MGRLVVPYGRVEDVGYHEILVNTRFAAELMTGGMTSVNGEPVRLTVACEMPALDAVILKWEPLGRVRAYAPGTYSWQEAA